MAATYVYVSAAEDGDIGIYRLESDGALKPAGRASVGPMVMPLAVSPDKRFLYANVRSKPFTVHTFAIDLKTGALKALSTGPLHENCPYISLDRTGRFLFSASYIANLVSVNPVGTDGRVGDPLQVIPTARNAHAILIDNTNRYVFVPHLGADQVFQFVFDPKSGRLAANTPPAVQLAQGTGPRHLRVAPDNRFVYVLNELTGTVTTLALDAATGCLTELFSTSALPPDTPLVPGVPRGAIGTPGANQGPRNTDNDIWASDLHLTPDGRFLYVAERTSHSLNALAVDSQTGKLTYLASVPTEKQPRGFAIDPGGKYLVASGEKSGTLSVYAIEANGGLEFLGKAATGKGSNWVEIVALD
jgi:6-phosphogluconolactonase